MGFLPNSPILVTISPGTDPWSANPKSIDGFSLSNLISTTSTIPDLALMSRALIFVFALTTTSFNTLLSSCKVMVRMDCSPTTTFLRFIPRKDTDSISPEAISKVKVPSASV